MIRTFIVDDNNIVIIFSRYMVFPIIRLIKAHTVSRICICCIVVNFDILGVDGVDIMSYETEYQND